MPKAVTDSRTRRSTPYNLRPRPGRPAPTLAPVSWQPLASPSTSAAMLYQPLRSRSSFSSDSTSSAPSTSAAMLYQPLYSRSSVSSAAQPAASDERVDYDDPMSSPEPSDLESLAPGRDAYGFLSPVPQAIPGIDQIFIGGTSEVYQIPGSGKVMQFAQKTAYGRPPAGCSCAQHNAASDPVGSAYHGGSSQIGQSADGQSDSEQSSSGSSQMDVDDNNDEDDDEDNEDNDNEDDNNEDDDEDDEEEEEEEAFIGSRASSSSVDEDGSEDESPGFLPPRDMSFGPVAPIPGFDQIMVGGLGMVIRRPGTGKVIQVAQKTAYRPPPAGRRSSTATSTQPSSSSSPTQPATTSRPPGAPAARYAVAATTSRPAASSQSAQAASIPALRSALRQRKQVRISSNPPDVKRF
ncbi:uncharacterized protein B0H18DRAFT_482507 [Fomitopsis serialis]|uniref:uncharacterized protein n=1 Tax=Fomitopsis serialis TaxID=139415 RepID=UPI0020084B3A|nr:uncharacterized protein B0H18DRAFT_482507 [Neoantrodia serialis]KAH9934636.1 hypothetical protein B0H18DRAFT_482507 [Neoantrodia serialis]